MDFKEIIKPFFWVEYNGGCSLCLNVGKYKENIFETRYDEGFEGGGYDWASLALVFLSEKLPKFKDIVKFDPEADMFCAYSNDKESLMEFALEFKKTCDDEKLLLDLFSRAELD